MTNYFKKSMLVFSVMIAININSAFAKSNEEKQEDCRVKLVKAQEIQVLHDLQLKKTGPYVVAGPTYETMSIDAKQGFAETINCFFMAGDSKKYILFDILDYKTGKPVATFTNGKLKVK